jgi:hypothetical protein
MSCAQIEEAEKRTVHKNIYTSSLCELQDTVFFSCVTKLKKIISLCGKQVSDKVIGVYYRFGRLGGIEMDYPSQKDESSFSKFKYDHYFRYRTDYLSVNFENDGYRYSIYHEYRGDDQETGDIYLSGIAVSKMGTNSTVIIKCSDIKVNNIPAVSKVIPERG